MYFVFIFNFCLLFNKLNLKFKCRVAQSSRETPSETAAGAWIIATFLKSCYYHDSMMYLLLSSTSARLTQYHKQQTTQLLKACFVYKISDIFQKLTRPSLFSSLQRFLKYQSRTHQIISTHNQISRLLFSLFCYQAPFVWKALLGLSSIPLQNDDTK